VGKREEVTGTVSPNELYTLEALKGRLGLREAALRSARRAGLKVYYKHGRGFVLGRDWIAYVCSPEGEALASDASCPQKCGKAADLADPGVTPTSRTVEIGQ
jgi:hypothetical protein